MGYERNEATRRIGRRPPDYADGRSTTFDNISYLPLNLVRSFAFWTITLSVIISVTASILAIWEYTETEVLWRTVATCVVIGAGTGVFTVINRWFGQKD